MFDKGEYIVYGTTGVCTVEDITTVDMNQTQKDRLYYILRPIGNRDSKIMTPVDNEKVCMRRILTKEEADLLINEIPVIEELWIADDKARERSYKEAVGTCSCKEYIKIIKTLYLRKQERIAQGKKVTATDERYLKLAENALYSELSIPLGIAKEDMEQYIAQHMG